MNIIQTEVHISNLLELLICVAVHTGIPFTLANIFEQSLKFTLVRYFAQFILTKNIMVTLKYPFGFQFKIHNVIIILAQISDQ